MGSIRPGSKSCCDARPSTWRSTCSFRRSTGSTIERINARGALIKVLDKPHLDLTTPLGRDFIAFLSAMAEDERGRILKRANDGRKVAKAKGVKFWAQTEAHPTPAG